MRKPVNTLLILLLVLLFCEGKAQDIVLSQPLMAPLHLGPFMAGSGKNPRANLLYRNQWPQLKGGTKFGYGSYEQFYEKQHLGTGAYYQFSSDTNGISIHKLALSGNYSIIIRGTQPEYRFSDKWPDHRYIGGIEIGYLHGIVDSEKYQDAFPNASLKNGFNAIDLGAGIAAMTKQAFIGISGQHLNYPNISVENGIVKKLPAKLTITGATTVYVDSKKTKNFASFLFHYTYQGRTKALNMGTCFGYGPATFGLYYRNREAFVLLAGINLKRFSILYTYDWDPVKRTVQRGATSEFGLVVYPFGKDDKKDFPSYIFPGMGE